MIKLLVKGFATLAMALFIAGCTSNAAKVSALIDGTYEGTARGMQGPIMVQMVVADAKTKSVGILSSKETPNIAKVALERIPSRIVETQSLKVDTVAGATIASNGIKNAVDPEAQSTMKLTRAQKSSMNTYLTLDPADPSLKFDRYHEWKPVLDQLKADIKAFYTVNQNKTLGVDMPGFDAISLHMWHTYTPAVYGS